MTSSLITAARLLLCVLGYVAKAWALLNDLGGRPRLAGYKGTWGSALTADLFVFPALLMASSYLKCFDSRPSGDWRSYSMAISIWRCQRDSISARNCTKLCTWWISYCLRFCKLPLYFSILEIMISTKATEQIKSALDLTVQLFRPDTRHFEVSSPIATAK